MPSVVVVAIFVVYVTACSGYNVSDVNGFHIEPVLDGDNQESTGSINETGDFIISFTSPEIYMIMDGTRSVNMSYTMACPTRQTIHRVKVYTTDRDVAYSTLPGIFNIPCDLQNDVYKSVIHGSLELGHHGTSYSNDLKPTPGYRNSDSTNFNPESRNRNSVPGDLDSKSRKDFVSGNLNINLKADLVGRTWLMFELMDSPSNSTSTLSDNGTDIFSDVKRYKIVVIRQHRTIDTVFRVLVYMFIIASTIGMGCKIEIPVVKAVLKKPIAPGIGFVCQYLCMPLIAFAVAKLVKFENPAVALGVFACGICPGGGVSNIYSYLLGGDVSLSITMTTISTIGALGMVPLWMFTLGEQFKDDKMEIKIPYWDIVQTLATVILPLFIGLAIKYKCQKVARIIIKVLKPVTFITVLILLTFGIYANLFIFRLFRPSSLLAGCMLPYFGYICGGIVGLVCRQPWYRVKTIAIETGIQNVMVAYLMLQMALDPPDGDLAAVGPAASACMTPLPLFLAAILYNIYLKCTNKKLEQISPEGQDNLTTEEKDGEIKQDMKNSIEKDNDVKVELLEKI